MRNISPGRACWVEGGFDIILIIYDYKLRAWRLA